MNCIFCKIIDGDINSYTIYEDDLVKSFLDINPYSNGHLLIIPKKHYKDLDDIDQSVLNHIMEVSKILKKKLEKKLNVDGLTLIENNGDIQEVKHFHLHLKPHYNNNKDIISVKDIYNILKDN